MTSESRDASQPVEMTCRQAERRKDRPAIFDLTAKCFSGGHNYYEWIEKHCKGGYFDYSHYDWPASTVGLVDGRVATHWGVWGFEMRVGQARLACAGIGAVATDGFRRQQGLMRRTVDAGLARIAERGYDVSLLYGIHDFYHKFGYVRAWAPPRYEAATSNLPTGPTPRVRRFKPLGRDDLQQMYNEQFARATGTAVRPTFSRTYGPNPPIGYVWDDDGGRPAGYVVVRSDKRHLSCWELVGPAETALAVVRKLARQAGRDEVHFPDLPYDSAVARWLRAGTCRLVQSYTRSGGPMIRTICLRSSLSKLAGELSARLGASPLADWSGTLRLADGRETVDLAIQRGRVEVVHPAGRAGSAIRGGDEIAQLLIGTDEPGLVIRQAGTTVTGDARALVEALFPAQHPTLAVLDHF